MDTRMLDFKYSYMITQSSQNLHSLLKNMSSVSNFVVIESDGVALALTAHGEFMKQSTIISDKGKVDRLGPIVFSNRYKIKTLLVASRCAALCMSCTVYFSDGMPLMLSYTAGPRGRIQAAFIAAQ
jgi:hypothetical protein